MAWVSPKETRRRRKNTALMLISMTVGLFLVIHIYTRKERVFTSHRLLPGIATYPQPNSVYAIQADSFSPHRVWFGTDAGIRIYDRRNESWHFLGLESGLASETVTAFEISPKKVWVGTYSGLQYWDRETETLKTCYMEGIKSNRIFDLFLMDSSLWVATGDGVVLWDVKKNKVKAFFHAQKELSGRETYCIVRHQINNNAYLLFGHEKGKISQFNLKDRRWSSIQLEANVPAKSGERGKESRGIRTVEGFSLLGERKNKYKVRTIIWDLLSRDKQLWAATSDEGVWRRTENNQEWKRFGPKEGFPAKGAYQLVWSDGELFCGVFQGMARWNSDLKFWTLHKRQTQWGEPVAVTSLYVDEDYIWYGTVGSGLGKFFPEQIEWFEYTAGLSRGRVQSLFAADSFLYVSFGFSGGGVDKIRKADFSWISNFNVSSGFCQSKISTLGFFDNSLIAGGLEGFTVRDQKTGNTRCFGTEDGLSGNEILGIVLGPLGKLYVGDMSGVFYTDDLTIGLESLEKFKIGTVSAFAGRNNLLVAGNVMGEVRGFDLISQKEIPFWLRGEGHPVQISPADSGAWVLYNDGKIFRIVAQEGTSLERALPFNKALKRAFKKDQISCLAWVDFRLWLGFEESGIFIGDFLQKKWHQLRFEQGLANNKIITLVPDSGLVWVGHNGAFSKIETDSLEAHLFRPQSPI